MRAGASPLRPIREPEAMVNPRAGGLGKKAGGEERRGRAHRESRAAVVFARARAALQPARAAAGIMPSGRKRRPAPQPDPPEDNSWVARTAERIDGPEAWRHTHHDRWKFAGLVGDAVLEPDFAKSAHEVAVVMDGLGDAAAEERLLERSRELAAMAAGYAREMVSVKPIRFDGPTGLRMIQGRPVQALVWGGPFSARAGGGGEGGGRRGPFWGKGGGGLAGGLAAGRAGRGVRPQARPCKAGSPRAGGLGEPRGGALG